MTHEHKCKGCDHCLHECKCCNKVYCCKCGQEWGGFTYYQPYYPEWGTTTLRYDTANISDVDCSHSH